MANDDLHPILKSIHRTLKETLKEGQKIKSEITKVHTAITEGVDKVLEAINDTIQAQAEMKMMEHMVEVKSILPQIDAERERVDVEEEELDRQLERIADRYEDKHDELDEKAASRIRDVGSHIFEIDENQFEEGIETPFAEHVTTAWMSLQAQNDAVGENRRERVESRTSEAVGEIHEFVKKQDELVEQIDRTRTDIETDVEEPKPIQLPYYTVEVEINGSTSTTLIEPSAVENDSEDGATLTPLPGMDSVVSACPINETRTEQIDQASITDNIEQYTTSDPPLVSTADAYKNALPDQVEVTIEEGT